MRFRTDIFKFSPTHIVIKNVLRARQAARTAHHRNTLPHARGSLAGSGRRGKVQVYIIRDYQIEQPVAIVINEGASRAPGFA